jgi:predicted transglutaminase-like cysteine proteinase
MRGAILALFTIAGFCQAASAQNYSSPTGHGVVLAAASKPAASANQRNEPFGLPTVRAPEGPLWVKFRDLKSLVQAEIAEARQCRENRDTCSPLTSNYLAIIDKARKQEGRRRIETVNSGVNGALRYLTDWSQHREPDKWTSPLAAFKAGRGDCEDFATAKFVALYAAGTPIEDLWLIVGYERVAREHHMVAAARVGQSWLILENRTPVLFDAKEYPNFNPQFLINNEAVREVRSTFTIDSIRRKKN